MKYFLRFITVMTAIIVLAAPVAAVTESRVAWAIVVVAASVTAACCAAAAIIMAWELD